jgi:hypothetical protein
MKRHILVALREMLDQWEDLLAPLTEAQVTSPLQPSHLSIKDIIAHLTAWQKLSNARVEAVQLDREPIMPMQFAGVDADAEGNTDGLNAAIFETHRQEPWEQVYQAWRQGFRQLLGGAEGVTERDLLDGGRFSWLGGSPPAVILLATYDHHREHLEELSNWLSEHATAG